MKAFFEKFIQNKFNLFILLAYISLGFLVLYTNTSWLWFIVATAMIAASILFEFKFKASFAKSVLIQFGVIVFLLVTVILYATIRDVYFENTGQQNPQTIENSSFYELCLSTSTKEGDEFLKANGYTENQDGSWTNDNGVYPTSEIESVMEKQMTTALFDCIEKRGATISNFDDVKHYPSRVRTEGYACADFNTWEDAQKVFIRDGGIENDVYNLDADGDRIACESLQ